MEPIGFSLKKKKTNPRKQKNRRIDSMWTVNENVQKKRRERNFFSKYTTISWHLAKGIQSVSEPVRFLFRIIILIVYQHFFVFNECDFERIFIYFVEFACNRMVEISFWMFCRPDGPFAKERAGVINLNEIKAIWSEKSNYPLVNTISLPFIFIVLIK